jgi:hypothetical protein
MAPLGDTLTMVLCAITHATTSPWMSNVMPSTCE